MTSKHYEEFMKMAIEEAKTSLKEGNKGFGAVVAKDGRVIASAHDTEVTDQDSIAHAEINAIRRASRIYKKDLTGCLIISTHEPCPMCTGSIIWSNISEVVYGVSIRDSIKVGRDMINLSCKEIIKRSSAEINIHNGILKKECLKLYNNDIRKLVKKFQTTKKFDWTITEEDLLNKRMQWFENNKTMIHKLKGNDLEKAYYLILMKIGIKSSEAPIVEKSENKIIFHSKNYCPSLEACIILDLDTREVCKEVYERPTEELIRRLNPKLKFTRNYECIRPYSDYCEEIITLEK
jgi:tRNA(Arg) A34 adenosine deaminase TadA